MTPEQEREAFEAWARDYKTAYPLTWEKYEAVIRPVAFHALAWQASASRSEWKPIETAPRDGTRILLSCPEEMDAGHHWTSADGKRSRWVWNGWPKYEPTKWMPLPQPPLQEGK